MNAPVIDPAIWPLDPDIAFLNHGSFGACPRPVFERYQAWQLELERQPVEFIGRRRVDLLREARSALARCRKALHEFARQQGLGPIRVLEEIGKPVPRGRSGKMLRVVGMPERCTASSAHAPLREPVR